MSSLTAPLTPSSGRTIGRQERGRETRRRLVHAATRLWSRRGFDAVTVEEICAEAGVGRTTFYLHFESKEQLLASLASATGAGVAADVRDEGPEASLDQRLDVFIAGVTRRMEEVPKSLAQLVIHSQRVHAMHHGEAGRSVPRFADLLRDVLTDARRRGELARGADTAELGEILGALTMDAIEGWASGRSANKRLDAVLRRRFALIVDRYRADERPRPEE